MLHDILTQMVCSPRLWSEIVFEEPRVPEHQYVSYLWKMSFQGLPAKEEPLKDLKWRVGTIDTQLNANHPGSSVVPPKWRDKARSPFSFNQTFVEKQ